MPIPKIIHQIWWQGSNKIPKKMLNYRKSWTTKHTDFTFIIWDKYLFEHLLHRLNIPIFNKIYIELPYIIQKIDFCKYIVLYHYGGLYVDIDTICEKPIHTFLNIKNLIVSKLKVYKKLNIYLVNNGVIFCKKKHIFFYYLIIEIYKNRKQKIYQNKDLYILESTGPLLFTKVIMKYLFLYKFKNIMILNPFYFESNEIDNHNYIKGLYITHIHNTSWISPFYKLHFKMIKLINNKYIGSIFVFVFIFIFVYILIL